MAEEELPAIAAARHAGTQLQVLAARAGMSRGVLAKRLTKAGFRPPRQGLSNVQVKQAAEWRRAGMIQTEIARRLSCSQTAVYNLLTKLGVTPDPKPVNEKMTAAYAAGESVRSIAKREGVSHGKVERELDRAGIPRREKEDERKREIGSRSKPPASRDTMVRIADERRWTTLRRWTWEQAHRRLPKSGAILRIEDDLPAGAADELANLIRVGRGTRAFINRRRCLDGADGREVRLGLILAAALSCCDRTVQVGNRRPAAARGERDEQ